LRQVDPRIDACCIRGMGRALILLAVTMLPGCGYYARTPPQTAVAPEPTIYPAPAGNEGRYIPWVSGWNFTTPIVGL